jgi:hypothetical protein
VTGSANDADLHGLKKTVFLLNAGQEGGRPGGGGGIPPKPACGRRGMKTGGRVSQALTHLLREFRSQGYALLLRNPDNLVYNLRRKYGNSATL